MFFIMIVRPGATDRRVDVKTIDCSIIIYSMKVRSIFSRSDDDAIHKAWNVDF